MLPPVQINCKTGENFLTAARIKPYSRRFVNSRTEENLTFCTGLSSKESIPFALRRKCNYRKCFQYLAPGFLVKCGSHFCTATIIIIELANIFS